MSPLSFYDIQDTHRKLILAFEYNDKIELVLKYTSTPKPTPPDDEEENNPDGNKHRRGFTIMQTTTEYEVYTTIGR